MRAAPRWPQLHVRLIATQEVIFAVRSIHVETALRTRVIALCVELSEGAEWHREPLTEDAETLLTHCGRTATAGERRGEVEG
jgi:hypothetical protein